MKKTLVLIRHAHRNVDDSLKDNGLSERGQDQVKKMVKFYKNRFEASKAAFFSSPKKRCIETISPVAKEAQAKLANVDERLDEHGPGENSALFFARMEEFLDVWKYEGEALTVICSHGDWIPYAVQKLTGREISLKKCGWVEIEYEEGLNPTLTWLVQKHY
jgi:broad specificity phosphatase PhoE